MNEQAVLVERKIGKPLMSSFHAGYSIGGVAGALFGSGMAVLQNVSVLSHFLIITGVFGAAAFIIRSHLR